MDTILKLSGFQYRMTFENKPQPFPESVKVLFMILTVMLIAIEVIVVNANVPY